MWVWGTHRLSTTQLQGMLCIHYTVYAPSRFSCVWVSATPWTSCLPDSSVPGILQARILERVTMLPSRGSFWPRVHTCVSCTAEPPGKALRTHTTQLIKQKIAENLTGIQISHVLMSPLNMQKQYRRHWPNSLGIINRTKSSTYVSATVTDLMSVCTSAFMTFQRFTCS